MLTEINFDGIVGPSHNYAGLSPGNLAATRTAGKVARPREAAPGAGPWTRTERASGPRFAG